MSKDFITGLVLREDSAEYTTARVSRGGLGTAESKTVPLNLISPVLFAEAVEEQRRPLADAIRTRCGRLHGHVSIGLPSTSVLIRILELPSVDLDELNGMVELQADKASPFPSENTVMSHEVLHQSTASSVVAVAVTQRKTVDTVAAVLREAHVAPKRLDVEVMGWWRLLNDAGEAAGPGCRFHVILDPGVCDLIVTLDSIPIMFRSLGRFSNLTPGDLSAEIEHTLATLEAERGIGHVMQVALWHSGPEPVEMAEGLKQATGIEILLRPLGILRPLSEGLARRAAGLARGIDLAPPEWRVAEQNLQMKKKFAGAALAMAGLWVALMLGFLGATYWQKNSVKLLQTRLKQVEEPLQKAKELRQLVLAADQYASRKNSALECLRETAEKKLDDIQFSSFRYADNRRVTVQGEASQANSVYDYEQALARSPVFSKVTLSGPKLLNSGRHSFTLTLEQPGNSE